MQFLSSVSGFEGLGGTPLSKLPRETLSPNSMNSQPTADELLAHVFFPYVQYLL